MDTKHFVHMHEALRSLEADPATLRDPIKRTFVCDGRYVSANLTLLEDTGDALHVQPNHDELVLILEGECGFRVGDEVTRVDENARLQLLLARAPVRFIPALLRQRYLALAVVLNLPGNTLLGGGAGIALCAGICGLYRLHGFVVAVAIAVAPMPIAFALFV